MGIPYFKVNFDSAGNLRGFVLHKNPKARYVQLLQDGTRDYYPLCEVEVYGILGKTNMLHPG